MSYREFREFREFNAFDIVRELYPKLLKLSKLSLIIGAVIVFTEIKKKERESPDCLLYSRNIFCKKTTNPMVV